MTYEIMEIVSGGRRQLVSTHASHEDAVAALPEGSVEDAGRGWWVTEDGRCYVIETVVA